VNQRNHVTAKKFAYSAAANYAFDPHLGVFLRYSKGYRYPNFDDLRNGNPERVRRQPAGRRGEVFQPAPVALRHCFL
jgi:outer membrane receptor protein involved in Fe transport